MNAPLVDTGIKRCAIYTRKSTEAGLELAFNSLDAQREAGEAYIKSQAHEGWVQIDTLYDDGGISGATMARPALQRLIGDIEQGLIDVVVVYKVDRLTRSLADFAKLVDLFDQHDVSFVSVTQSFNTTSSMGRLTLNVLLSFAQFEREVTSERIRDKITASKKKGLYMGGHPPLGYMVRDKKLMIDKSEAQLIKHIYNEYIRLRSLRALKRVLDKEGYITKLWVTKKGKTRGGKSFSLGHLRHILQNPIYTGRVIHKDQTYDGKHKAVISEALFERVQKVFADHRRQTSENTYNATKGFLLKGILFDDNNNAMTPHTTQRGKGRDKKLYTYYVSIPHLKGEPEKAGSLPRVNHRDLDQLVTFHVGKILRGSQDHMFLNELSAQWLEGNIGQRQEIIQKLGLTIILSEQMIRLTFTKIPEGDIEKTIPIHLKHSASETKIILPKEVTQKRQANGALVKAVTQAYIWNKKLMAGEFSSIRALAKQYGYSERPVAKTLRLAYLAADIIEAILDGAQPERLTVSDLQSCEALHWDDQRRFLGFATN